MRAAYGAGEESEIHAIMHRLRHVLDADSGENDVDDLLDPRTAQLYSELLREQGSYSP